MASNSPSGAKGAPEGIRKLSADPEVLREEAHAVGEAARTREEQDDQTQLRKLALLADQMQRPATINSIEIHGAKNTRRSFLNPIFQPLVHGGRNAGTTLGDVLAGLEEAVTRLERFDIFRPHPTVYLSEPQQTDPASTATDLDISIRVAEKSRFILKTGTDLGNTEGSAYGNLLWRNMFGGAESLSLNASAGTRTRSAYSAAFSTPVSSDPNLRLAIEGLASSTQKPWASHEEVLKGGSVRLAWLSPAGDQHSVAYAGTWRQLTGLAAAASPTVRADAGDSVKSSLCHTFTRDRRDNPMLPQNGYFVRTIAELAGWGPLSGDVSFAKSELELTAAHPVPLPGVSGRTGISIGGGLRLGLLYPLPLGYAPTGKTLPSRVNDRFQLGGPTDVRGFKLGGLGPRDGGDAVGGDVFAAGSVNMLLPLPRLGPDSPLRFQLFANAGRLVAMRAKGAAKESEKGAGLDARKVRDGMRAALFDLANGLPSAAAGFGLVYAHPVARFELNFSLPLVLRRGEEGRKGLQVGVGINFL